MFNNNIKYLEKLFKDIDHDQKPFDGVAEAENVNAYEPLLEKEAIPLEIDNNIFQDEIKKQSRVDSLLWAFRDVGYIYANLNPLGNDYQEHYTNMPLIRSGIFEKLTIKEFGLSNEDLDKTFFSGPALNHEKKTLREILEVYNKIYCSSAGIEFLHIQNKPVRKWFIQNLESEREKYHLSLSEKKTILEDLIKTEELEHFLHKNYLGQKRFSIEGGESLIPCLHFLVNTSFSFDVKEIVIGTTHRGRLSILNSILQLPLEDIFFLFEDQFDPELIDAGGDVKYHIGYTMEHKHSGNKSIRITLPPNASHLESIGPVAEGRARGLQVIDNDKEKKQVIPVILHGEAAFSGQGVVAETLNLSGLKGYSTGGTIHIIINNQVGFTTSTRDEHSSKFASDIAKALSLPVMHVNGDDPLEVVQLMKFALDYRQTFNSDILIDIICYRKYGHNEGDEPSFSHPHMYEIIKDHKSVASIYSEYCIINNIMTKGEIELIRENYTKDLKKSFDKLHNDKNFVGHAGAHPHKIKHFDHEFLLKNDIGLNEKTIFKISDGINKIPENFKIHEKLEHIIETRYNNFKKKGVVDWAFAESIAFGSLLLDGISVRLSGQDCERGTFSQRHLVWWKTNTLEPKSYIPLNHLSDGQAEMFVFDSPLSEYSILGFEYGYSISCPDQLVIWEAQFGDFSNGAQVIIDNYIIAAEAKWNLKSGIVLLLPHGYEGQGPEHSYGHFDRFLQLSAQENIQVCNVTTPIQYFCLLRRQVKLKIEKPLIIMTPKSLLRHPLAISSIDEFIKGHFEFVIDDSTSANGKSKKIIFCTGKIYYDLFKKRDELKKNNIAIIRIEQLYPFPQKEMEKILIKYKNVIDKFWVQEEPQNRGAWTFIKYQFENLFNIKLQYIGRNPSASPATGSLSLFKVEQEKILTNALM